MLATFADPTVDSGGNFPTKDVKLLKSSTCGEIISPFTKVYGLGTII